MARDGAPLTAPLGPFLRRRGGATSPLTLKEWLEEYATRAECRITGG